MLTLSAMRQCFPTLPAAKAAEFFPHLSVACTEFDITTPRRIAAFLAQLAVESNDLRAWEEGLYYRAERLPAVWGVFAVDASLPPSKRLPNLLARQYERNPQELANFVYADKNGNGDEASGDGWNYRGRGPIQLTGKANYAAIGAALGVDLVSNPDLAATPAVGFRVAGEFWDRGNCNSLAERGQVDAITRCINGRAMLHKVERRERYEKNLTTLSPAAL